MKKPSVLSTAMLAMLVWAAAAATAAALASQPRQTIAASKLASGSSGRRIGGRISSDAYGEDNYAPHLRSKIASSVAKGERRADERSARPRRVCDRCARPPALCVCRSLPPAAVPTGTSVLVLQHPNERRKKNFSTVPLLRLVLEKVRVKVGYSFDFDELDIVGEGQGRAPPLLLFPGPDAVDLGSTDMTTGRGAADAGSNAAGGDTDGNLLILIDGTWAEAKRMVRDSPSLLERCRRVQFSSSSDIQPSIYHAVRREPEPHCLSTLEACAKALDILEEDGPVVVGDKSASDHLRAVLGRHVESHLTNAALAADPRHNQDATSGNEKDRRRMEIERDMFNDGAAEEESNSSSRSTPATAKDSTEHFTPIELDGGEATVRPLRPSDAPLVDSWWDHRSSTSLSTVARCISADRTVHACLGIEGDDGELRGCIVRYADGAVGMLHVAEAYRQRGYGTALLREATRALEERGEECVAFILDGNDASEALFSRVGWERDDPTLKKGTGRRRANRKWVKR